MKRFGELTVLVVENEDDHAIIVTTQLARLGFGATRRARSLAEGIEAAADVDVVLLDLSLPDSTGVDSVEAFTARLPEIPVVVLTASRDETLSEAVVRAGAQDFLVKGDLTPSELDRSLRFARERHFNYRRILELTRELESANERLARLAGTDGLTGLFNRRHFEEVMAAEWRRCGRLGLPLSLLLLDLDDFKSVNDVQGHPVGDEALVAVAEILRANSRREVDHAARLGGDEFALVLSGGDEARARSMAERVLTGVRGIRRPCRVTASVGVATAHPGRATAYPTLIREADRALYAAKRRGRDAWQSSD
ncbi:MAG: diguanylate cyclase [Planctomycetota bacterium]